MELVGFYRALLPAHGLYCLWQKATKRHYWFRDVDALVQATERVASSPDWYFGVASFGAEQRRTQANVAGKRCLYLDIDAGPEKYAKHPDEVYPTQRDAQAALIEFTKASGLMPTMIVSSGAGLHVYYAFDQDVTEDEWAPLAAALGRLAKRSGLRADPACTTDSARVLRPLGALHASGSRVRLLKATGRTYTYEKLRGLLPMEQEQFALAAPSRAKLDVNGDLPMFESAPSSALKVAEHCAALREVAVARGDVQEPLWRAMIGLVKHTVEGEDQAHEWSCGYEGYDERETAEKYNRYEAGPTTCEHFSRHTKACEGCEHRGKITSPIVLGRMTVRQVEALPEDKRPAPAPPPPPPPADSPLAGADFGEGYRHVKTPAGYALEARKVVETEDADGQKVRNYVWVRISDEAFWLCDWSEAGATDGESAMTKLTLYSNAAKALRSWTMPTRALATAQDLFKLLGDKAITRASVDPTVTSLMHNYINSQFAKVRAASPRFAVRQRFGLQFDSDNEHARLVAAQGRYVIRPDGTIEEAVLGSETVKHRELMTIRGLTPTADGRWPASVWKDIKAGAQSHVEFLRKYYTRPGYEVAQLATMLSLASPFMVFAADTRIVPGADLPAGGLTVSLFSTSSGQGKTSMMKVIASAYGDPSAMVRSGARNDATLNSQSAFAGLMGTVPLYLDEVTQNGPAEVAELVNRISMGHDRERANRSGQYRTTKSWALIGTVSSNIPQREMLSAQQKTSDALQMRVLELNCEFPVLEPGAHVEFERDRDQMIAPYYGCLGAMIHLSIVSVGPERMRSTVQRAFDEAASIIPEASQRERFFQRGMACVLACHDVLERMGLAPFNRDDLIRQYAAAATEAVKYIIQVRKSPDDLLRKMISEMAPHIIVTKDLGWGRLEPVRNAQQLRAPYAGRRLESSRTVIVLADAIRDWAVENQVSYSELLKTAAGMGLLVPVMEGADLTPKRFTLTRGTDLSTVHGNAIALNEALLFGENEASVPHNVVPLRAANT